MRRLCPIIVTISLLSLSPLFAADSDRDNIPEGMELIEIGQTKVLVPEGSKVDKRGGLVLLENQNSWSAHGHMYYLEKDYKVN